MPFYSYSKKLFRDSSRSIFFKMIMHFTEDAVAVNAPLWKRKPWGVKERERKRERERGKAV